MRVAILGLGAIGSAITERLHAEGAELTIWNRTRDRATQIGARLGVSVADTPAHAVADTAIALTALADRAACEAVFSGADGILAGAHPGLVVCDLSTVEPSVSRSLAPVLRAKGADVIDTPISGSTVLARRGELTIMIGGDDEAIARARPVLELLGRQLFHVGPVGSGAAMKLAVNTVLHGLNEALAEGLVLAESAGIPRSLAYDILAKSAVGAPFVHYKRRNFEDPDNASVDFRLALVCKDLRLIREFAEQTGVLLPQLDTNLRVAQRACEQMGDRDMSTLAVYLRKHSKQLADEP
ncbi:MAG: NAD(P)-dependent oxidoreductase [Acidothermus sp.]|nr:NAD(P)-dependent oxidoreductase [Acidothermus sp.]MCL6537766.1 NAD(P)-dependent oxidoreductase [Acidothermus sp.]